MFPLKPGYGHQRGRPSDEHQLRAACDGATNVKFFWRLKKEEATAEPAAANDSTVEATSAGADPAQAKAVIADRENVAVKAKGSEGGEDAEEAADEPASNVVTLQSARLTERIAAAAVKTVTSLAAAEPVSLVPDITRPRAPGALPGQEAAYQHLTRAAAAASHNAHILVAGKTGTGRRTAVLDILEKERDRLTRPCDWVYLASSDGQRMEAFSLPHGQGALLAREANAAITRVCSSYERLAASDDFRLGLEIIDEEYRQRASKTLELLKRRAEDQNIALVKTPEGFVLAPMHEGKVVRNDMFRALPEAMQREVEAKISDLESELKGFLDSLPAEDISQAQRIEAFHHDAAARAVRPHIDTIRIAFPECSAVLDALQGALVAGICGDAAAQKNRRRLGAMPQVLEAQAASDFSAKAPLVFVHDVSVGALCGEVGGDGAGRQALKPGALMQANGGFIVVEAWRLAADPKAWAALTSALETGHIEPAGSGANAVDPIPFAGRVVLITDEHALARLLSLDAGLRRYFAHVVRFPSALPRTSMGVAEYAGFAAALAAAEGLRPIAASAADALYRAALARDGDANSVTLDAHALRTLLLEADLQADADDAAHIRASHIEAATCRASDLIV